MRPVTFSEGCEGVLESWDTTPVFLVLRVPSAWFLYAPRFYLPLGGSWLKGQCRAPRHQWRRRGS